MRNYSLLRHLRRAGTAIQLHPGRDAVGHWRVFRAEAREPATGIWDFSIA